MDNIRKTFAVCSQNFRKWSSNPRIVIILLLLVAFISMSEQGVRLFAQTVHVAVSVWMFPFLMADWYNLFIFMLGLVMLFCDAPFLDDQQPYLIIRSGKKCWLAGQILYIFSGSALYFLAIWAISILLLLPNVAFSTQWGKIIRTLAETSVGGNFNIPLPFSDRIIQQFQPIQAMGLSFLMSWLAGSFLGLLMFVINLHTSRAIGALAASGIVLLEVMALNGGYDLYALRFFSPVSWASLDILDFTHTAQNPSFEYAVFVLVGMIAILIILAVMSMRKRAIEVLPQI